MNNAQYIIDNIKYQIPIEILNMAFMPAYNMGSFPISLDSHIKQKIVTEKVSRDCNMVAGQEAIVSLMDVPIEIVNGGLLVRVGFGPTNGRLISSVLNINYGFTATYFGGPTIASALSPPMQISDGRIELVGENVVYIEGWIGVNISNLRCILDDDPEFSNFNPRIMPTVVKLCILAAKAYIYNTLTIRIGSGVIVQGIDMGRIKDIIDSYSDAIVDYHQVLEEEYFKTRIMGDRKACNKLIRMMIPS